MPSQTKQSPAVLSAARDFAHRVAAAWPMRGALLFGSQARGNAHAGSDTDVAVLLNGAPGDFVATKLALDDVAYDVLLDSGIRIQPLPIWEPEWAHPERYSNPRLLENIAREGLAL
jgi:antitoxin ChpS